MFSASDTIVAIATPPGRGGIGVVRLSGPEASAIARRMMATEKSLEPRYARLVELRSVGAGENPLNETIDQAILTFFPAPHSYTGDDVVEMSAHGSPVVLQAIVRAAIDSGARLAEPGEFTLRAFLNGRIDLPQAEAVADLVDAVTPLQARTAFDQLQGTLTASIAEIDGELFDLIARLEASVDFPDEGFHFIDPGSLACAVDRTEQRLARLLGDARRGRLVREGLQVAIVGRPNVGKSSLFNALVGASRAIVTPVPGTTRDLVTETIDLEGFRVTVVDTAGLRDTEDPVESEGVRRTQGAASVADVTLVVYDRSQPVSPESGLILLNTDNKRLIVANKSDLHPAWSSPDAVNVSATTGEGMNALRRRVIEALNVDVIQDRPAITNIRHITLLERAHEALLAARAALGRDGLLSEEFLLADLQGARTALEEITGPRAGDEVLAHIFERFCIGK